MGRVGVGGLRVEPGALEPRGGARQRERDRGRDAEDAERRPRRELLERGGDARGRRRRPGSSSEIRAAIAKRPTPSSVSEGNSHSQSTIAWLSQAMAAGQGGDGDARAAGLPRRRVRAKPTPTATKNPPRSSTPTSPSELSTENPRLWA